MAKLVRDVMTPDPVTVETNIAIIDVARKMRDHDVGAIIVMNNGGIAGVITDRDLAIRGVAERRDPTTTTAGEICSPNLVGLEPTATLANAAELMRYNAVRRLPVVQGDTPVGIVSLGDLVEAEEKQSAKVLAGITAAEPNR